MFGHFAEPVAGGAFVDGVVVVNGVVLVAAGVGGRGAAGCRVCDRGAPARERRRRGDAREDRGKSLVHSNHLLQLSGAELRVNPAQLGGLWELAGSFLCVDPG